MEGQRREYACAACGRPWWTAHPPRALHRECRALLREAVGHAAADGASAEAPPSLLRRAWNLAGAVARFAADGFRTVDTATYERRLAACDDCPHRRGGACSLCGCLLTAKAALPKEDCPDDPSRWHPNAGNWWHDEGRVAYRTAERVEGLGTKVEGKSNAVLASTLSRPPSTLLLRFPHGIGDHLMFTIVLRHLRELRPDLAIDVQCNAACTRALSGLCRRAMKTDEGPGSGVEGKTDGSESGAERDYDLQYDVPFYESDSVFPDLRTGKAGKCLWESFGILPRPEWACYRVTIDDAARARADAWTRRNGLGTNGRRFALVHYQGHTGRRRKDLPALAVRAALDRIAAAGVVPVLLDWTGKSSLRSHPAVVPLGDDEALWGRAPGADVATLAALAGQAALCVGIDSGPGHVFGAAVEGAISGQQSADGSTRNPQPPTVIVWTHHHPVHFYGLAPHVTHLLPIDHERNIHGDPALCRDFFQRHYRQRTYVHLGKELAAICEEILNSPRRHGDTEELMIE